MSPTHLHEFKSADRLSTQTPIMSLYLPEQKLGSRSGAESSSHKFMLKGRQTGSMHRGHAWVFRAESRDTMLAWYDDIKNLTEKTGEERNAFVRQHARSVSGGSQKPASVSSDGAMDEDEADQVPYSATASQISQPLPQQDHLLKRPQPGGRFPSDLNVGRNLLVPLSPSSGASSEDSDIVATAGALSGSDARNGQSDHSVRNKENMTASDTLPGGGAGKPSTREIYTPKAQTSEYNGLKEPPAMHGSTQQSPAKVDAAQPGPAHEGLMPLPTGVSTNASHYDSYVPIAQKAEYNDLPVHEGTYVPSQKALVVGDTATEGAPEISPVTSNRGAYVPTAPQTEYFGFPVIPGALEPEPQTSAPRASTQQTSTQQTSTRELSTQPGVEYNDQPVQTHGLSSDGPGAVSYGSQQQPPPPSAHPPKPIPHELVRHDSNYGDWLGPKAAGVANPESGLGAAKGSQQPAQQDSIDHDEQQKQVVQQLPQSGPSTLDTTTPAPPNLPPPSGPVTSPSTEGFATDGIAASTSAPLSSITPTPETNSTGPDPPETPSASGAGSLIIDTTMPPPPPPPGAGSSLNDSAPSAAESQRPGTDADGVLPRLGSHFHVPGEYPPPTPTAG